MGGTPAVAVDLGDVQGLILRGYTMPVACYIGLAVREVGAARAFLGAVSDDSAVPSVTSARPWEVKPESCVNLGITFPGLVALEVPAESRASFPAEYAEGAVARAARVGDVGDSDPSRWLDWLADPALHVVLVVYAQSPEALTAATAGLQAAWGAGFRELGRLGGERLPGDVAHFGYRDGLSQPTVEGVPLSGLPDSFEPAPVGAFLLGYPSQFEGRSYPVPTPPALGRNGSYAALRVLEQDVDGFAAFLSRQAAVTGLSEELIAAKLCGRWRNGVPLVLSPDTDTPDTPIPPEGLNDFDYVGAFGDERGYRCPIGSHVRRMFPRGSRVAGNTGQRRRIVRRGIPYGPAYDPAHPHDEKERGLLGLFIGASLAGQFEFLTTQWLNDGTFAPGLGRTRDPMAGANDAAVGRFSIADPAGPIVLEGLPSFVTTRGGAYCFLPSLTALRHLADLRP